jgi:hypothetical protein
MTSGRQLALKLAPDPPPEPVESPEPAENLAEPELPLA